MRLAREGTTAGAVTPSSLILGSGWRADGCDGCVPACVMLKRRGEIGGEGYIRLIQVRFIAEEQSAGCLQVFASRSGEGFSLEAAEVTAPGEQGDEAAGVEQEEEGVGVRAKRRVKTQRAPQLEGSIACKFSVNPIWRTRNSVNFHCDFACWHISSQQNKV